MFWPVRSNSKVLGVPTDSQVPISGVWMSSSHSPQSKVAIGPMIMVETCDIDKLAEYIRIPSMVERVTVKDTTLQRILYLGLPNQCWKCHRFGHFAQTCIVTRIPIWSGSVPVSIPPMWSERVARGPTDTSATQFATHSHRNGRKQGSLNKRSSREIRPTSQMEGDQTRQSAPTKTGKD